MKTTSMRPLFAAALLAAISGIAIPRLSYDPDPWLRDLDQLQNETRVGYANLEWSVARNELDLKRIATGSERTIRSAGTAWEARQALHAYAAAFADPHFKLTAPPHPLAGLLPGRKPKAAERLERGTSGGTACRALRFEDRARGFRLKFGGLEGYRPVQREDNAFEAGVLRLDDGRRMGLLRIAHFGEDGYRSSCVRAWEEFRNGLTEDCEGECLTRFRTAVSDRMLRELHERVVELQRVAPDGLVVDVTGNGGGTNWADAAARVLTARPLHGPKLAFVRDAHWLKRFGPALETIRRDLERPGITAVQRALLEDAAARVTALAEAAACGAETAGQEAAACSNLVRGEYFATGVFSHAYRSQLEGLESASLLFRPIRYGYREGAYTGALIVLIDRNTASAAEYFAAILKDNGAATLVGERTAGAGCGYTSGGRDVRLARSGLRVWMPDCVRLRRDGTNEADGVAPDLVAGWSDEHDGRARAARVVTALAKLPS